MEHAIHAPTAIRHSRMFYEMIMSSYTQFYACMTLSNVFSKQDMGMSSINGRVWDRECS